MTKGARMAALTGWCVGNAILLILLALWLQRQSITWLTFVGVWLFLSAWGLGFYVGLVHMASHKRVAPKPYKPHKYAYGVEGCPAGIVWESRDGMVIVTRPYHTPDKLLVTLSDSVATVAHFWLSVERTRQTYVWLEGVGQSIVYEDIVDGVRRVLSLVRLQWGGPTSLQLSYDSDPVVNALVKLAPAEVDSLANSLRLYYETLLRPMRGERNDAQPFKVL